MSTVTLVVTIVFAVLALIILTTCILKSMSRTVFKSSMSLLVILLSLAISMLISGVVGKEVVNVMLENGMVEHSEEIFAQFPLAEDIIIGLGSMLLAPLFFGLIFFVLRLVLSIISAIMISIVQTRMPEKEFVRLSSKPIGAVIGLVCGVILCVVYFTPISGYTGIVSTVAENGFLSEGSDTLLLEEGLTEEEYKQLDEFVNMPVFSITRTLGGNLLFSELCASQIGTLKVSLPKEVVAFCDLAVSLMPLSNMEMSEWTEKEITAIEEGIPNALENSSLLRVVIAEVLSGASSAWLDGEDYLGVERPEMDDLLASAFDSVLKIFENTTPETVQSDISGITPILSAALKFAQLEQNGSEEDIWNIIGELADTPETKKILMTTGINMLGSSLGLYQSKEAIYDEYTEALAQISSKNLSVESMQTEIALLNERYVVEMTESEIAVLSHSMKQNPYTGSIAMLSTVATLSENEMLDEWIQEIANEVTNTEESLGWLLEKEEIPTELVTVEDLSAFTEEEEMLESFGKDDMLAIIEEVKGLMNSGANVTVESLTAQFGATIQSFTKTEAGISLLNSLVEGVLQSENVCSSFGITPAQATVIAQKIRESDLIRNLNSETDMAAKIKEFIKELESTGVFQNM